MKRWIALLCDFHVVCMIVLVPTMFTSTHTHTVVFKEIVFQNLVWMMLPFITVDAFLSRKRFAFPVALCTGALLVWLLISTFGVAQHPRASMEFIRWLAYLAFMIAIACWGQNTRRLSLALTSILAVTTVVSVYGILQAFEIEWFFEWDAFSWDGSTVRRVGASFGNPDFLANFLVATLPLTLFTAWALRSGTVRILLGISFVLQATALFFTYSRGAQIALIATAILIAMGLLVLNIVHNGRWLRVSWPMLVCSGLGLCLAAAGMVWFAPESLSAWMERLQQIGQGTSSMTRLQFYQAAIEMIAAAPLLGHGLGMFDVAFTNFRPDALGEVLHFTEFRVEHAHNELLQVTTETGLIGVAIYLVLILASLSGAARTAFRGRTTEALLQLGLAFGLIALCIHNLFTVALRYTSSAFLLWMLLGLLFARTMSYSSKSRIPAWKVMFPVALVVSPLLMIQATRYHIGDWLIQAGKTRIEAIDRSASLSANRDVVQEALLHLHRAKELHPSNVETYFYLGLIYNQIIYDYPQGRRYYEELDALYPNFTSTRMNLGINALDLAEMLGSPNKLRTLMGTSPTEPLPFEPFEDIAITTVTEVQARAYQGTLDDPTEPSFSFLLGRSHLAMMEYDPATEAFEEAIRKAEARSPWEYRVFIEDCQRYIAIMQQFRSAIIEAPEPEASR